MTALFAILAVERTGSSVFRSLLNSCGRILCHGEIFHPRAEWHIDARVRPMLNLADQKRAPVRFVDRILACTLGYEVVGFKTFFGHEDRALDYILRNRAIRKIILRRDNILAMYSSLKLAQQTDVWNIPSSASLEAVPAGDGADLPIEEWIDMELAGLAAGGTEYGAGAVDFDQAEFEDFWGHNNAAYEYYESGLARSSQQALDLTYESAVLSRSRSSEALSFLGVDGVDAALLSADIGKLNSRSILRRFSDPAAVAAYLDACEHLHWARE